MSEIIKPSLEIIKTTISNLRPRDLKNGCYEISATQSLEDAVDLIIEVMGNDGRYACAKIENTINCYIQMDPMIPRIGEFYFSYDQMAFLPEGGLDRYIGHWKYIDWSNLTSLMATHDIFSMTLEGYKPLEIMDRVYSCGIYTNANTDIIIEDCGNGKIIFWKDEREYNFWQWVQDHPEHPLYKKYINISPRI